MEKIKELLILLLSFLCGSAITYIANYFKGIEHIAFIICVIIIISLSGIIIYQKIKESRTTRFAVIVFILNSKNDLLLVLNKTHRILLPPCKTMMNNEMPHQAVQRILKEQVNLTPNDYEIDLHLHKQIYQFDRVLDCYTPFAAQQEYITKQSKNIRYHYSLEYVYRIKDNVKLDPSTEYFPRFFSLVEINAMTPECKPFQDIIKRYNNILQILNTNEEMNK